MRVVFACCVVCFPPRMLCFFKLYWQATRDQVRRSTVVIGVSRPLVAVVLRPRFVARRSALLLLHVLVRQLRELREPPRGDWLPLDPVASSPEEVLFMNIGNVRERLVPSHPFHGASC